MAYIKDDEDKYDPKTIKMCKDRMRKAQKKKAHSALKGKRFSLNIVCSHAFVCVCRVVCVLDRLHILRAVLLFDEPYVCLLFSRTCRLCRCKLDIAKFRPDNLEVCIEDVYIKQILYRQAKSQGKYS